MYKSNRNRVAEILTDLQISNDDRPYNLKTALFEQLERDIESIQPLEERTIVRGNIVWAIQNGLLDLRQTAGTGPRAGFARLGAL